MKYIIPLLLLISCNAAKQAERKANKLLKNHPEVVLPIFRGAFPCTTLKIDTVYNWHDTTLWIECPPAKVDTFTQIETQAILSPIRVKKVVSIQTIKLTEFVEDSAKITALNIEISRLKNALNTSEANYTKYKLRSRTYLLAFFILLAATLVSLFVNYIEIKK